MQHSKIAVDQTAHMKSINTKLAEIELTISTDVFLRVIFGRKSGQIQFLDTRIYKILMDRIAYPDQKFQIILKVLTLCKRKATVGKYPAQRKLHRD